MEFIHLNGGKLINGTNDYTETDGTTITLTPEIRETEICECECHQDKSNTRHVTACCGTSGKYITTTGEIDMVRWAQCYRATRDRVR